MLRAIPYHSSIGARGHHSAFQRIKACHLNQRADLSRGVGDRHRPQSAGIALPGIDCAIQNHPAADEKTDVELQEFTRRVFGAQNKLCPAGSAGIILQEDRDADTFGQRSLQVDMAPGSHFLLWYLQRLRPIPKKKRHRDAQAGHAGARVRRL